MTNQTIKFRAKNASGLWLYGNLIDCGNFKSVVDADELGKRPLDWVGHLVATSAVQEDTIGQYTGLKDKSGREIYEGDILMRDGDPLCYVIRYSDNCASFFAENDSFPHESKFLVDEDLSEWEVICNIYDNKNLLED